MLQVAHGTGKCRACVCWRRPPRGPGRQHRLPHPSLVRTQSTVLGRRARRRLADPQSIHTLDMALNISYILVLCRTEVVRRSLAQHLNRHMTGIERGSKLLFWSSWFTAHLVFSDVAGSMVAKSHDERVFPSVIAAIIDVTFFFHHHYLILGRGVVIVG